MCEISELCRLCVRMSHSSVNIFEDYSSGNRRVFKIIENVCQLDMPLDDGLPKYICEECYSKLLEFNLYKTQAHKGTAALKLLRDKAIDKRKENRNEATSVQEENKNPETSEFCIKEEELIIEGDDYIDEPTEESAQVEVNEEMPVEDERPLDNEEGKSTPEVKSEPEEGERNVCEVTGGHSPTPVAANSTEKEPAEDDFPRLKLEPDEHEDFDPKAVSLQSTSVADDDRFDTGSPLPEVWEESESDGITRRDTEDLPEEGFLGFSDSPVERCPIRENLFRQIENLLEKGLRKEGSDEGTGFKSTACHVSPLISEGKDAGISDQAEETASTETMNPVSVRTTRKRKSRTKIVCEEGGKKRRRKKSKGRKFECHLCGSMLSRKDALERHMVVHGTGGFICSVCGKRCTSPTTLRIHSRVHTGEKPYGCSICDARFMLTDSLNLHMRRHSGNKPYRCPTCSKRFFTSSDRNKHEKIHSGVRPFKCLICDIAFYDRGNLTVHMRVHTGERPYKCDECAKRFISSSHLQRHRRLHTGIKPFECSLCGKSFACKDGLKTHLKTHLRLIQSYWK